MRGMHAGQAIVQMAVSQSTRREYAMKFFICRDSFDLERALYSGDNPLGQFLPEARPHARGSLADRQIPNIQDYFLGLS